MFEEFIDFYVIIGTNSYKNKRKEKELAKEWSATIEKQKVEVKSEDGIVLRGTESKYKEPERYYDKIFEFLRNI